MEIIVYDERAVNEQMMDKLREAASACTDLDVEISLSFVSLDEIHELNRDYRGVDRPTDVLSFPMYDLGELPHGSTADGATVLLGDIVVSVERAAAQAAELGHSTDREIAFLCIHSTLHLLGYDHERSQKEDEDMCLRQREIIAKLDFEV